MIESHIYKLLMMFDLNCAILMRALLRLSLHIGESLDECFARFESIVSSLRFYASLAYSDNERPKQLLYALDDSVWGMKITALEESADFATLDIENCLAS
jgi:hypothetical protein